MSPGNSAETDPALAKTGQIGSNISAPPTSANPNVEGNRLEQLLPQIRDLAQKVGGYDKLADLARELSRGGT